MSRRTAFFISAMAIAVWGYAQSPVNKTLTVQPGQKIEMLFDYPELIRVSTWDKNEISIQGTVSINGGESDEAFEILTSTSGNTISIRNEIKNMKDLPQRITIVDGLQKIVFKNKAEFKKYQEEHGKGKFQMMSTGVDMDILLEIKVPRNTNTKVESVYGMVEIRDFLAPLTVKATYGGVDAALTEKTTGEIIAETNYGEIYTNLDAKFGGDKFRDENFHTYVSAKPGTGPDYSFESKYGNVYIRKAK
jgi:hypothetical protein